MIIRILTGVDVVMVDELVEVKDLIRIARRESINAAAAEREARVRALRERAKAAGSYPA